MMLCTNWHIESEGLRLNFYFDGFMWSLIYFFAKFLEILTIGSLENGTFLLK